MRHQLAFAREFFWHRLRWRVVAEYLPEDRPFVLVDIGAGAGVIGDFLERERPKASYHFVEALDFLEAHLELRFGAAANARSMQGVEQADFVTLLDVLEHQDDDGAFLSDLVTPMRRGTKLLLTVPALSWLWSEWDVSLGHFRRYDRDSLLAVVRGFPLRVCEVSYLFPEMILPALVRKRARLAQRSASSVEFPDLPRLANHVLYGIGRATVPLRKRVPLGTSLFAALERI